MEEAKRVGKPLKTFQIDLGKCSRMHAELVLLPPTVPPPLLPIYGKPELSTSGCPCFWPPPGPLQLSVLITKITVTNLPCQTNCSQPTCCQPLVSGRWLVAQSSWAKLSLTTLFQNRWFSAKWLLIKSVLGQMVIDQRVLRRVAIPLIVSPNCY